MYTPNDINAIIQSKIDMIKKAYPPRNTTQPIQPEFYPGYKMACEFKEKVERHSEITEFPEKLFLARAPNMTDKEFTYLKENYKQTTITVYMDYFSTRSLPFQDGNWSIQYQEDDESFITTGETLQKYLEEQIDNYGSLENFIKATYAHLKDIDANGLIAVKPEIMYLENGEVDTSKLPKPQLFYYPCNQIISKTADDHYLVILNERTNVEYGGGQLKIGYVFEFYDEKNIWRIEQVGKFLDFEFSYHLIVEHNWDRVPAKITSGVPKVIDNSVVYAPPFLYACDNLDLALMNAQYLQVSVTNACFPYLVMIGDTCENRFTDEESGEIFACDNGWFNMPNGKRKMCTTCNGSGMKDRTTPFGRLLIKTGETWKGEGDKPFAGNAMYYVSPETTALEFVRGQIEINTNTARKILHLQTSTTETQVQPGSDNTTATGMFIDQKAKHAFVKPISDQDFDMYEFLIDAIGYLRYGDKYKEPTLIYPNTFDYNTEEDYIYRIAEARKNNFPPMIIFTLFHKYLHTLYYNEKKTEQVFSLIIQADTIFTLSQDEINLKLSRGVIEKWKCTLHDSGINLVNALVRENPKLFELKIEDQISQLVAKAQAATPQASGPVNTQSVIDGILSPVNNDNVAA